MDGQTIDVCRGIGFIPGTPEYAECQVAQASQGGGAPAPQGPRPEAPTVVPWDARLDPQGEAALVAATAAGTPSALPPPPPETPQPGPRPQASLYGGSGTPQSTGIGGGPGGSIGPMGAPGDGVVDARTLGGIGMGADPGMTLGAPQPALGPRPTTPSPAGPAVGGADMSRSVSNQLLGIPGGPGNPEQAATQFLVGSDPEAQWLMGTGLGSEAIHGLDPAADPRQYARYIAQGLGLENADQYALANEALVASSPIMYALMNPGAPGLNTGGEAAFAQEWVEGMNTPGQYLDPSTLYDNIFSEGAMTASGALGPDSYDNPKQYEQAQVQAVYGALSALAPYMTQTSLMGVQGQLDSAIVQWQDHRLKGGTMDLITYLTSIGAADWL